MDITGIMRTEIQKLYDTETQLIQALTFLASRAQSDDLRQALDDHREETREHVRRLETICNELGCPPTGQQSQTTRALVQEAQQMIDTMPPSAVTDACIIAAAQKSEHLEMAAYGFAASLSDEMDNDSVRDLLGQTLDEEKAADKRLTKIAEHGINKDAVKMSGAKMM